MSDKKAKTIEDRLVDTILPLVIWTSHKVFGPLFTSTEWHQIATSLVPPSDSLRINIIRGWKAREDYAAYATEAVHSPSRRRRLRRYAQHCFQHMLRNDPGFRSGLPTTVDYPLQWRKNFEAAGYKADLTRIRKLTEVDAKIKRDFDVLSRNTIIIEQWLPSEKVLDPRFYPAIMKERGQQCYAYEVIMLLEEFALYARALEIKNVTPNSHILALLGLDRRKLKAPETCLIEFFEK